MAIKSIYISGNLDDPLELAWVFQVAEEFCRNNSVKLNRVVGDALRAYLGLPTLPPPDDRPSYISQLQALQTKMKMEQKESKGKANGSKRPGPC